jgi:rSAM/selenodomain-associated transferase 2
MSRVVEISVVIPVFGDTEPLARLLRQLRAQAPAEIVVVDGAASAGCRALCAREGAVHLESAPGRGRQLRHGAERARGSALWFLHADAEIPAGALAAVTRALLAGAAGGHFRFRFAGAPDWRKRALAALVNLRVRVGVPYGDQGLFATREAYARAGGFADAPLFEEVPLVRGLRRSGPLVTLPEAIGVSPRRWERDGWVRRSLGNRLLALGYMAGISPRRLARRYRAGEPQAHETGR